MKDSVISPSVVCFGEILWDCLPAGKRPGGAPMNVAYHLHKLGLTSHLISSVGNDAAGLELLDFLKSIGLSTAHVQRDEAHKTSEVLASIDESSHEVTYEIIAPVAWDYIRWQADMIPLLEQASAFVFGTLSSRNPASRETLYQMLAYGKYNVFDVNLRAPHYSQDVIDVLLGKANLVKLNSSELHMITSWFSSDALKEIDAIDLLFTRYGMDEIIITKGSAGATYYTSEFRYDYPAYTTTIADTVGSGDSFLAAFLAMKLGNQPVEVTLDYAVAMGAFITSQAGACPDYAKFDLDRFIWKKKLNIR